MNLKPWWQSHYGGTMPLHYHLRKQIPERWLRIHSLPDSKRYAEDEQEYAILRERHAAVAADVLGSGSCFLFKWCYALPTQPPYGVIGVEDSAFAWFDSIQELDALGSSDTISIWHAPVGWSPGRWDDLIRAVADWREGNLLFANATTGEAYAPYDGGADLFLRSKSRRDALKQKYEAWLSPHPSGL